MADTLLSSPGGPPDYTTTLLPVAISTLCVLSTVVCYWWTCQRGGVLLRKKRTTLRIAEIEEVSSDTKRIRLAFPRSNMTLGLPVGKHFKVYAPNPGKGQAEWNGREDPEASRLEIERPYTPVTGDEVKGYVDLVVKMYRPGTFTMPDGRDVKWTDGGKMSGRSLDKKQIGDYVDINGPFGLVQYLGKGVFKCPGLGTAHYSHVAMMAGGSGLTPMLQVLQASVRDPEDTTKFSLIYANKTEDDILCRGMLDDAERKGKGRIKIDYTLDFPPEQWGYSVGFINPSMIKRDLPGPESNALVLLCGPPPMVEFACKKNLSAMGYDMKRVVCF